MNDLPVVLMCSEARIPSRVHESDAGLDLFPLGEVHLFSGRAVRVSVGISVGIPDGHVGLICGRSGLSFEGVDVLGGVIDSSYTGEIGVILFNHNSYPISVPKIRAVAQLLVVPIANLNPVRVKTLPWSERGSSGFGSSDKAAP